MSGDRHAQVREVFLRAIELEPARRESFVHDACGADNGLRHDVETLLQHHASETIIARSSARTVTPFLDSADEPAPLRRERTVQLAGRFLAGLFRSRNRRILGILAALVLLALLGSWTHLKVAESLRENVGQQLQALLRADVAALERWIREIRQDVRAWSQDGEARASAERLLLLAESLGWDAQAIHRSPDNQNFLAHFKPFISEPGNAAVALVNRSGRVVSSNVDRAIGLQFNAVGLSYLEKVFARRVIFIRPYPADSFLKDPQVLVFPRPVVWVIAPVHDAQGQVIAALGFAQFADEDFSDILSVARMGKTGETYAFDTRGIMLSNSRFDEDLQRIGLLPRVPRARSMLSVELRDPGGDMIAGFRPTEDISQRPWTRLVQAAIDGQPHQREGVILEPYRDYRGVLDLGAWTWLPEYDFGVATEVDAAEADRPLRYVETMLAVLLAVLATCLAAAILSSFVVVQLRQQARAALRVGQYTLVKVIGEGGMGKVYLAEHALLKRPTAVKMIKPDQLTDESVARFAREVQLASSLTHPNTIEIYDYGRSEEGLFYYAMEYLGGQTLAELVARDGSLPAARCVHLLKQICGSLREAHAAGLVHRDIKPQNIMLCERGGLFDVVKVLDFGLVKPVADLEGMQVTGARRLIGTPAYMAPERLRDAVDTDPRSDIFALGAVGYFLLAGTGPFEGADSFTVIQKVLETDPQPPSQLVDTAIPARLERLILSCLAKDAADRPQSVTAIQQQLQTLDTSWSQEEAQACWK